MFESRREGWIVVSSNFTLFDGVDVSVSFDKLLKKLIIGWMMLSEFVVDNDCWDEIAWIFERAIALDEELTFKLSLEGFNFNC